jgi:hypothetical protein
MTNNSYMIGTPYKTKAIREAPTGVSLIDAIDTMGDALQSTYLQRVIVTMNSQRDEF